MANAEENPSSVLFTVVKVGCSESSLSTKVTESLEQVLVCNVCVMHFRLFFWIKKKEGDSWSSSDLHNIWYQGDAKGPKIKSLYCCNDLPREVKLKNCCIDICIYIENVDSEIDDTFFVFSFISTYFTFTRPVSKLIITVLTRQGSL